MSEENFDSMAQLVRPLAAHRSVSSLGTPGVLEAGFVVDQMPEAPRDTYRLVYVIRGTARYRGRRGQSLELTPGTAVQTWPNETGRMTIDRNGQWVAAYFHLSLGFAEQLRQAGTLDLSRHVLRPGKDSKLIDQFDQLVRALRNGPDTALAWTLLAAHQLVVEMHTRDQTADPPLSDQAIMEKAGQLLGSELEKDLTDEAVAERVGVSPMRLRQVFRRMIGMEPDDYRRMRRMDRAQSMLAEGGLNWSTVAQQVGYKDPGRFDQQFRRAVGQRPQVVAQTS